MKLATLSELAELTGKTWRTIRKRLKDRGIRPTKADRKSEWYRTDRALAAVYEPVQPLPKDALNLEQQRARHSKALADSRELDLAFRRGELASLPAIEKELAYALAVFRSNTLAIPTRVAPELEGRTAAEIKAILDRETRQLLESIANFDFATCKDAVAG